jgi:hypothetical protein
MMTDTFDNLKPFDLVYGWDLVDLYNQVNKKLFSSTYNFKIELIKSKSDRIPSTYEAGKPYFLLSGLMADDISNPTVDVYYENTMNPKQLSCDLRKGDRRVSGFSSNLRCELFYKKVATNFCYLYVPIPHDFINNHMCRSHGGGNLEIVREYVDEVNKSENGWTPNNYIKLMNEFDDKYPKKVKYLGKGEKAPYFYEWRSDFILSLYLSAKEFGIFNPVINTCPYDLFNSGSHRMSVIPMLKEDVPMFIKINPEFAYSDNFLYLLTPPWFSLDGSELLSFGVEVDIRDKSINLIGLTYSEIEEFVELDNVDIYFKHKVSPREINEFVKSKFDEKNIKIKIK